MTTQINESYATVKPSVEPSYSELGPHYDILIRNELPKIAPYPEDHPPPVGEINGDQFHNAEDHMYVAVSKKNNIKKQEGGTN